MSNLMHTIISFYIFFQIFTIVIPLFIIHDFQNRKRYSMQYHVTPLTILGILISLPWSLTFFIIYLFVKTLRIDKVFNYLDHAKDKPLLTIKTKKDR